jgi:hypothetical protein
LALAPTANHEAIFAATRVDDFVVIGLAKWTLHEVTVVENRRCKPVSYRKLFVLGKSRQVNPRFSEWIQGLHSSFRAERNLPSAVEKV